MSMLLKVICGTMFLLGMSWNIMAKGVIKGRVVDSQSKEVLVGATVNVEGTTVGCATDAEGYFELEVEESGTVILVFRSVGYSEVKKSVVVDAERISYWVQDGNSCHSSSIHVFLFSPFTSCSK